MDLLNMVFTGLFTVEMVLKIIAFKPRVGTFGVGGGSHEVGGGSSFRVPPPTFNVPPSPALLL